jgi:ribosomal protein L25 (general stress protein Ctc)
MAISLDSGKPIIAIDMHQTERMKDEGYGNHQRAGTQGGISGVVYGTHGANRHWYIRTPENWNDFVSI